MKYQGEKRKLISLFFSFFLILFRAEALMAKVYCTNLSTCFASCKSINDARIGFFDPQKYLMTRVRKRSLIPLYVSEDKLTCLIGIELALNLNIGINKSVYLFDIYDRVGAHSKSKHPSTIIVYFSSVHGLYFDSNANIRTMDRDKKVQNLFSLPYTWIHNSSFILLFSFLPFS